MKKKIATFSNYFRRFLQDRHTHRDGICSLDVPDATTTYLGIFFVTAISEWGMEEETQSSDKVTAKPIYEFFDRNIERYLARRSAGGEVWLDRSPEECEALGRRVASILAGWIEEVDRRRENLRSEFPFLYSRAEPGAAHRPQTLAGLFSTFVADYRLNVEDGVTLGLPFEFFDELGWRCIAGLSCWIYGSDLISRLGASYEPIATPSQFQELGLSFMKMMAVWIGGLDLHMPQDKKRPASRLRWNWRRRNFGFRRRS